MLMGRKIFGQKCVSLAVCICACRVCVCVGGGGGGGGVCVLTDQTLLLFSSACRRESAFSMLQ